MSAACFCTMCSIKVLIRNKNNEARWDFGLAWLRGNGEAQANKAEQHLCYDWLQLWSAILLCMCSDRLSLISRAADMNSISFLPSSVHHTHTHAIRGVQLQHVFTSDSTSTRSLIASVLLSNFTFGILSTDLLYPFLCFHVSCQQ